ncbi:MAG: tripartite tricarboxylate transporter TctB family protein [Bacillota bacterium]
MKRYERIAGLLLLAVGTAAALYSVFYLKFGTLKRPDSGMMPFLAGSVLALFSALWLWAGRGRDESPQPFWEKGEWVRPALALGLLLLYAVTMEWIGYLLSTLLFLGGWQVLVERERWLRAAIVTVVGTAGMYLLFARLLGVPVPPGIFGR